MTTPLALDLFCGAGGLTLGLTRAGFRIVGALDSWKPALNTYRANFSHPIVPRNARSLSAKELVAEIGAFEPGSLDLVAGGPPCQGFSIQRIGNDVDERNTLVSEFGRFVRELRPKMFLMENVPGIRGRRGSNLLSRFTDEMLASGYRTRTVLLNAADYGVPQVRKRLFCFGWLSSELVPFVEPPTTCRERDYRTVWETIGGLVSPPSDFRPLAGDPLHRRMRVSERNMQRLRLIPPGGGFEDLPVDLRAECHKDGPEKIGHRNVYGRLAPDRPAVTITARFDSFTRGKFGHPFEDRTITLREGARLQSFPDDFQFLGTQEEVAALIGNAVPPILAEALGSSLIAHLKGRSGTAGSRKEQDEAALPLFGGTMRA